MGTTTRASTSTSTGTGSSASAFSSARTGGKTSPARIRVAARSVSTSASTHKCSAMVRVTGTSQ